MPQIAAGALALVLGFAALGWRVLETGPEGSGGTHADGLQASGWCLVALGAGSLAVAYATRPATQLLCLIFPLLAVVGVLAVPITAPAAAVTFGLIAAAQAALLPVAARTLAAPAGQICACLACGISVLDCYGVLFRAPALLIIPDMWGASMTVAVASFALSLAVLAAGPPTGVARVLFDSGVSAVFTRRLLAAALVVLPLVGLLLIAGQNAGWYGIHVRFAMMVAANVILVLLVGLVTGARSARMEAAGAATRAELRQQNQIGLIMSTTPTAFAVRGLDGRYQMASRAFEELYHLAPGGAIGLADHDLHTPEQLTEVVRRDRTVLGSGQPMIFEDETWDEEHGTRTFVTTLFPLCDENGRPEAICSGMTEITELRVAEGRFKSLLDASPEAMICVNAEGRIVLANARALQVFRYERAELVGASVESLVPEARRARHIAHRRDYLANPVPRPMGEGMRLTGVRSDGTEFPVEISLATVDGDSGPVVFAAVQDITERLVQAQTDAQLAAIVETSSEAIISKDLDGNVLTWNPGAERLYGWTAARMIGRNVSVLLPADRPGEERELLARVRDGEIIKHHETRRVRHDGHAIYVSLSMGPVRDPAGTIVGASTIAHDITADVEAEQRLRSEREQLEMIMAAASDPFVSMDEHGRITEFNGQAERVFGRRRDEVLGVEVVGNIVPGRYAGALDRVLDGRWDWLLDRPTEMYALRRDGTELPIELTLWRTRRNGTPTFHAFARDITARRQTQLALGQARDQAIEMARLKSQFLASMSHEIRTPMNGVIGLSGLLLETALDPKQRQFAEGIRNAGLGLLSVINDVLDFSKLEAGKVLPDRVDFEVPRLLDEVVALLTDCTGDKSLTVFAHCDPRIAHPICGDAGKLRQVLLNLVGNAIKFTERGQVAVTATPVGDSGSGVPLPVRFAVTDTGIGIEEDKHGLLFEPFTQADAGTTRRFGGTGLGLAICHELVAVMGGKIDLTSRPGQGSTFSFTVPLWPATADVVAPAPAPAVTTGRASGQGHVLLVEDNEINQTVALGILAGLGWTADVAADGRAAVAMAAAGDYQAIFMDCLMPEMDGYTATAEIRRGEAAGVHVPIIAMTAGAMAEDRARCLEAGMDDHIAKPVMPQDIAGALDRARAGQPPPEPAGDVRREIEQRLELLRSAAPTLDGDALSGLLRRLTEQVPALVDDIYHALALDHAEALAGAAHQLKGAAGNIGAQSLADVADRVEKAARAADMDAAVAAVTGLRPVAQRTLDAAETVATALSSAHS
ncbi:PAS domain S-box protein [Actinoplanes sp. NPDC051861]|uniref:PAS domain-containing hybrid sensor histidine kinase/response regulator n=1 Tax=Actinoplanes sp. NPDC051861 TaxID=3155170 RepID=UPI003428B9E1